ncbi:MAG TPA: low molecular weight protein-tyrosine-phosphatase [Gammaproteobacteria bacterium]|nr:low molecular weight protein-tyrosine-phosphatase [Gammaproteobacteria bacterium]
MIRVLFVCTGNICRSPTAEGVFRNLVRESGLDELIDTDSAGTHFYHVGASPDRRARDAASRRGVDISDLRARQVDGYDFEAFDYILAMDAMNLEFLLAECPTEHRHRIHAFLDFAPDAAEREVPDPYYGGQNGFEHVLDLIEAASRGLLARIRSEHGLTAS